MSPSGLLIDPFAFARESREISESCPVDSFERLADAVLVPEGSLQAAFYAWRDADGKSWLKLDLKGALVLQCQRCLEALTWPVEVSSLFLLVRDDDELPEDDLEEDAWDCLPVGKRLDLRQIVEDEALLAMPFAPRHDDCSAPSPADGGERTSPFAGLAQLRKPEGRG